MLSPYHWPGNWKDGKPVTEITHSIRKAFRDQGNINQNHNEIPLFHCQNALLSKKPKLTSVGEDMETLKYLCTICGNGKWCSCY